MANLVRSRWTRRRTLGAFVAGGTTAFAPWARAIGPGSLVGIGHLQHDGDWNHRPEALRRVLWETGRRTSIDVARDASVVSLKDDALFHHPLLVLTGTERMPALSDSERVRLLRHLRFGGLLWIDTPSPDAPFLRQCEAELDALLGAASIEKLERDHVMFKSFFLLDRVVGRLDERVALRGITVQGRTSVLISSCDVLGALERDRFGTWRFECTPGGDKQRERAMRFAVNVMMYATCLDYKTDQVHIPFIMKKKRR